MSTWSPAGVGWRRPSSTWRQMTPISSSSSILIRTANSSPPSRTAATQFLTEASRQAATVQQFVADGMPKRVVDVLEAVDVDEQEREVLAGLQAGERQRQRFDQLRAVAEASERIAEGESRRPVLAFGELLVRAPHVPQHEKSDEPDERGDTGERGHQPVEHLGPGPARLPRQPRARPFLRHRHLDPDLPFDRLGAVREREIVDRKLLREIAQELSFEKAHADRDRRRAIAEQCRVVVGHDRRRRHQRGFVIDVAEDGAGDRLGQRFRLAVLVRARDDNVLRFA